MLPRNLLTLLSLYILLYLIQATCGEPQFRLNPKRACPKKNLELLVWIHSAPDHSRKRTAIRLTWGSSDFYKGIYKARVVFFVGLPSAGAMNTTIERANAVQSRLEFEQERYNDIVQGQFIDSYKNMTHKAIHSLRWISLYCSAAKFIMKVDDDIIVNVYKLLPYLRLKQFKNYYPKSIISCNLWANAQPMRDQDSKWFISKAEYYPERYPPFCQGMVYFVTPDLIPRLYNQSLYEPYVFMDDVYVTGILASKLTKPIVYFKKLSSEYARAYGIGQKIVTYVETHKKRVTFIHTDTIDSYMESWGIIKEANQNWDINSFVPKPYTQTIRLSNEGS